MASRACRTSRRRRPLVFIPPPDPLARRTHSTTTQPPSISLRRAGRRCRFRHVVFALFDLSVTKWSDSGKPLCITGDLTLPHAGRKCQDQRAFNDLCCPRHRRARTASDSRGESMRRTKSTTRTAVLAAAALAISGSLAGIASSPAAAVAKAHDGFALAAQQPTMDGTSIQAAVKAAKKAAGPDGRVSVIAKLTDSSLASYRGGVAGLAATSPKVTGAKKLNPADANSRQIPELSALTDELLPGALRGERARRRASASGSTSWSVGWR